MSPMHQEHLGWQMMRRIHTTLRIDEAWTEWHDDGFTWWAHKVAQRFRFEGPVDVSGIETWWVAFETDFLKVSGSDQDVAAARAKALADELNRKHGIFSAAPVGARLALRNRTYALEETMAHRCWQLGERALFANILANRVVNAIDAGTSTWERGIEPDVSAHPRNRTRSLPDEMLNVIDDVYRAKDMVLPAPNVAEAAATLEMGGFVRAGERYVGDGHAGSVALERHDETWGGPIVVVIDPEAQDELVGSGMRVRSVLPGAAEGADEAGARTVDAAWPESADAARAETADAARAETADAARAETADAARSQALALNEAAWTTHEPLVGTGAWSAGPDGSLVHTSFYPRVSLAKQHVVGAVMEEMGHGVWGAGMARSSTR